jgi:hypothetical protein
MLTFPKTLSRAMRRAKAAANAASAALPCDPFGRSRSLRATRKAESLTASDQAEGLATFGPALYVFGPDLAAGGDGINDLGSFLDALRYVESFGYIFAARNVFDAFAPQANRDGISGVPGAWGVYDPYADFEGWALVGDDPVALLVETAEDLSYSSGLALPRTES